MTLVGRYQLEAVSETRGAAVGLAELDALQDDERLAQYQPYWAAAHAELLARAAQLATADAAFQQAIGLGADPAVRRFLQERGTDLSRRP